MALTKIDPAVVKPVTATGTAVARPFADRFADGIHVFDFIPSQFHNAIAANTPSDSYDAGPDINAALVQSVSAGGKPVNLVGGAYAATTVVVPAGATLHGSKNRLMAGVLDQPIVKLMPNGSIEGPLVLWAASVPGETDGYSATAFLLESTGTSTWYDPRRPTTFNNMLIYNGKQHLNQDAAFKTGTGFMMRSTSGGRIWGVVGTRLYVIGFNENVKIQGEGSGWVNSNKIFGGSAVYGIRQIVIDGAQACADGNVIFMDIQPHVTANDCQRAIYCNGMSNQIHSHVWDWEVMGRPIGDPYYHSIEFGPLGGKNLLTTNENPNKIKNWRRPKLDSENRLVTYGHGQPADQLIYPHTKDYQTFAGSQDDLLTFCAELGTVSQVSGASPSAGNLSRITDLDGQLGCTWSDLTNPIVLLFTLPVAEAYFQGVGLGFAFDRYATNVKIETSQDNVTFTTRLDETGLLSARVAYAEDNHALNVRYIRVTMSGAASGQTHIHLARASAFGSGPGRAFLPTRNPVISGSITAVLEEYTATAIANIAGAPNVTGKVKGKRIWDTTNNREMRASGPNAADPWHAVGGGVTVTPA